MHICDQASIRPHRCAVLPYVGNRSAQGFIDTGSEIDGWHIYVSFEAACEMASMLGWSGPSVSRGLEQENATLTAELDQVKADLAEAERQIEAIDFLGSKDFVARQKRGPKKKEMTTTTTAKAA